MLELLGQPFFQRVLLAGLLASVTCGIVGTYVVAKNVSSISGGLSHAAFGGVGLGYWLGVSPMLGAAAFGVIAAIVVGLVYRRIGTALDTTISMIWSVGMALGIVFVALTPGYAPDLLSYLFGSLLFVPWDYVYLVALLDAVIVVAVALFWKELQALTFDEEFAEVVGVPVEVLFLALLSLSALAIVTLMRVVGAILAIALLTVPAVVARQWSDRMATMMVLASTLSAACTVGGLLVSYELSAGFDVSIPPGPLIVLLAAASYGVSTAVRYLRGRRLVPAA